MTEFGNGLLKPKQRLVSASGMVETPSPLGETKVGLAKAES